MNDGIEPTVKQKQIRRIVAWMEAHGGITQQDAYEISITRLPARIDEMRKMGYQICDKWVNGINQFGDRCRWKEYSFDR